MVCKFFPPSLGYVFTLLMVSFNVQNLFLFDVVLLAYF